MTLHEKLRVFIDKNMVVFGEEAQYSDEDNIFQLGFVNSLFAMKLLNFVEKEFNVTVEDDELNIDNFSSVARIARLVEKKRVDA